MSPLSPMVPTIRSGSRSRSSLPSPDFSSRSSAGETTISPAAGNLSTPGGRGARTPSGSSSRPRMSSSRKVVSALATTSVLSAFGG